MAKALPVGTKSTCRTCSTEIVWKPPVEDLPYSMRWLHVNTDDVACKSDVDWMQATRAAPTEYCTQNKADYSGPCHAPVVDDELRMCAIHAKKEMQYRDAQESNLERAGIDKTLEDFLEPLCQHLNDFYDLDARREIFDWSQARQSGRRNTGYIVVNPAKLVELLKEIEDIF